MFINDSFFFVSFRCVQHVVFGVAHLIEAMVPDIPHSLDIKMRRERYLAKQALTDSDNIIKVSNFNSLLLVLERTAREN